MPQPSQPHATAGTRATVVYEPTVAHPQRTYFVLRAPAPSADADADMQQQLNDFEQEVLTRTGMPLRPAQRAALLRAAVQARKLHRDEQESAAGCVTASELAQTVPIAALARADTDDSMADPAAADEAGAENVVEGHALLGDEPVLSIPAIPGEPEAEGPPLTRGQRVKRWMRTKGPKVAAGVAIAAVCVGIVGLTVVFPFGAIILVAALGGVVCLTGGAAAANEARRSRA
jgi:hypothetical protein